MMTYDQWKTRSPDDEAYHGKPYGEIRCEECDGQTDVNENEYGEFICDNCLSRNAVHLEAAQ